MHELELKKHKTLEERLDSLERQKYYCNICKRNHYYDTKIGKEHFSLRKKDKSKSSHEKIWNDIKILHDKANDLMKKQSILSVDLRIKYKELSKKNPSTKIFKNIKDRILNMENKHRKLSAEITNALREKDLLLKKV